MVKSDRSLESLFPPVGCETKIICSVSDPRFPLFHVRDACPILKDKPRSKLAVCKDVNVPCDHEKKRTRFSFRMSLQCSVQGAVFLTSILWNHP